MIIFLFSYFYWSPSLSSYRSPPFTLPSRCALQMRMHRASKWHTKRLRQVQSSEMMMRKLHARFFSFFFLFFFHSKLTSIQQISVRLGQQNNSCKCITCCTQTLLTKQFLMNLRGESERERGGERASVKHHVHVCVCACVFAVCVFGTIKNVLHAQTIFKHSNFSTK